MLFFIIYFLFAYKCLPNVEQYLINQFSMLFLEQRSMWLNIILGIACSMVVVCISELSGYYVIKKSAIQTFLFECNKMNIMYGDVVNLYFNGTDDESRKLYLSILKADYSVVSNAYSDIAFFLPSNHYRKHLIKLYNLVLNVYFKTKEAKKGLEISNEKVNKSAIENLNKYMIYGVKLGENEYRTTYINEDIEHEILTLQNYLSKYIWYDKCDTIISIPKVCNIHINIIKWSKEIKEDYVNYVNHKEYMRIPLLKYKIRISISFYLKQNFKMLISFIKNLIKIKKD